MQAGMMWFDNNPKTALNEKVIRAANYYAKKYGRVPNICLVHPSMLPGAQAEENGSPGGIVVRPYRPVLPGHLWIGIEERS